jgi:uncharacterized protein
MATTTRDITMDIEAQNENDDYDPRADMKRIRSASAITISPELFEKVTSRRGIQLTKKLYVQPKFPVVGDFRQRFANPTPLGFMGYLNHKVSNPSFAISTATFSMILMGWGGATTLTSVVYHPNIPH